MKDTGDAERRQRVRRKMERFERRCEELGLALTHQRSVIYRALAAAEDHPTPEAVYETVRREIPVISLGTVYKNIRVFIDAGLLREAGMPHRSVRLDSNLERHHHLVCSSCEAIFDIGEEDLNELELKRKPPHFRVDGYRVEFSGVCAACANAEGTESS